MQEPTRGRQPGHQARSYFGQIQVTWNDLTVGLKAALLHEILANKRSPKA
jgi:hypothetical protein